MTEQNDCHLKVDEAVVKLNTRTTKNNLLQGKMSPCLLTLLLKSIPSDFPDLDAEEAPPLDV